MIQDIAYWHTCGTLSSRISVADDLDRDRLIDLQFLLRPPAVRGFALGAPAGVTEEFPCARDIERRGGFECFLAGSELCFEADFASGLVLGISR